jgi:uroporphyrin-III C-methyltransferase/precorrin-2 dehydrogenase/sirohydrochlorin ferrochelatase
MAQARGPARAPAPAGRISLDGAGPAARDLMTLRSVQRLHEADLHFCPPRLDPGCLDLARRDADRVALAAEPGRAARQIRAAALPGRCVVVLVPGEGSAEGAAFRAAGIAVEMVPGVASHDLCDDGRSSRTDARRDQPVPIPLHA